MCPLCVALVLACGPRSVAPRPDFLIGRAFAFHLGELRSLSASALFFLGVSRGLLACCSSLRTPRATSKVTHYYSSSHSFPRPLGQKSAPAGRYASAARAFISPTAFEQARGGALGAGGGRVGFAGGGLF